MFVNPYKNIGTTVQRANFHLHAGTGPNTCGAYEIDEVIEAYKTYGLYGALCISNHNLYTEPAPYKHHGLALLPGYEYTRDIHMLCIGTEKVELSSDQAAIDSALADGGFAIINHPNWQHEWFVPKETFDKLHGFIGIEIYNGCADTGEAFYDERYNGRCNASNVYDYLLSKGRLVWCFGNDDFHRWCHFLITWNVIYAERDNESIMQAIRDGRFYVSTGLILDYLKLENDRISISVKNQHGFRDVYRYVFIGKNGHVLKEVQSDTACYDLHGDESYVRVEVTASNGHMLYTQPIYDEDQFICEFKR